MLASSHYFEVGAGLREAQRSVWTSANNIGVLIILTIILPETHGTNVKAATLREGFKSTAGASIINTFHRMFNDRSTVESITVVFEPPEH